MLIDFNFSPSPTIIMIPYQVNSYCRLISIVRHHQQLWWLHLKLTYVANWYHFLPTLTKMNRNVDWFQFFAITDNCDVYISNYLIELRVGDWKKKTLATDWKAIPRWKKIPDFAFLKGWRNATFLKIDPGFIPIRND